MGFVVGLGAALLGGTLLHKAGVPAGAMIGAMLGVAAVKIADVAVPDLHDGLQFITYIAVGWLLGQSFHAGLPRELLERAAPILLTVAALLVFSLVLAWALWATGLMDPATAYLAAAPGGIAQMGVISSDVRADTAVVVSVHLLRVGAVIVLAPLIVRVVAHLGEAS